MALLMQGLCPRDKWSSLLHLNVTEIVMIISVPQASGFIGDPRLCKL